jgi:hypothetical protein
MIALGAQDGVQGFLLAFVTRFVAVDILGLPPLHRLAPKPSPRSPACSSPPSG